MDTFRDELAKRYPKHGHALWDPDPGELYDAVQVGDVGFIREGYFCRLFNALHPDRRPSDPNVPPDPDNPSSLDRSSNPEPRDIPEYPPRLQPNTPHIRRCRENQRDFCSKNITKESHQPGGNTHALGPDDDAQVTVTCSGKQGALLSLPFPAEREDTVARGVFGEWIVKNINHCVRIAEARGLGLHPTEDIILVTGRHLARSWINVAFSETREVHSISGGELKLGPSGENLPKDQCIFIRGYHVVRFLNIWQRLRAMAEPAPDMHDPEPESDTRLELIGVPADADYRDPLHVLLEYIAEQAPDCDMALVHDDDLRCMDVAVSLLLSRHALPLIPLVTGNSSAARCLDRPFPGSRAGNTAIPVW
ncbi:hypothetical protein BC826DRAFT_1036136 [Russula brevipes]|nr:hypothetical protein BC826DRAFT_1036136 [Russula brevipes]